MRLSRLVAFMFVASGTAFAQSPAVKPARVLTPPTIDGRLDDPSWIVRANFDTRYRHASQVNPHILRTDAYTRTNRAIFTKLQYLFRYQS